MANFFDDENLKEQDSSDAQNESLDVQTYDNGSLLDNTSTQQSEDSTAPDQLPQEDSSVDSNSESQQPEDESKSDIEVLTPSDSAKPAKTKKPLSKKSKLIIGITVATIAVILLGIVLPIVVYHAPRIFVKSAEDFVAGDKVGAIGKYFYVLDNDVNAESLTLEGQNVYSIDLHKHTLSVSGEFKISTDATGTLYIGTRKSDTEYTNKKANLKARTLTINAPNLDVVIVADLTCETLNVTAKSFNVANTTNGDYANTNMSITAQKVVFSGNISASASSKINLVSCEDVVVNSNVTISNDMALTDSHITANANSSLSNLVLNENSTASIYGSVSLIDGGKQVIMQTGHKCPTYQNIETLVIFRDTNATSISKSCKNVIYVEKLLAPTDINIEEVDGKIYCVVSRVAYASSYDFYIGDELVKNSVEPKVDITEYVKEAGTYNIKVVPVGDYSPEVDLSTKGSCTMYINGDAISTTYNCEFTLQAPQNLKVTANADGTYVLSFNSVLHAEKYNITIDGVTIDRKDPASTSEDITEYIKKVGNHTIKVQAMNSNANIHNSKESMTSYYYTEKLSATSDLTASINDELTSINAKWTDVPNGYEYKVMLKVGDGSFVEVGRTSIVGENGAMSFEINFAELGIEFEYSTNYTVAVIALGHDYYNDSAQQNSVINIAPPQNSTPQA